MKLRERVWEIVEASKPGDTASRIFDIAMLSLIFLNVLAAMVGTVQSVHQRFGASLLRFERVSILVFTIEYLLRVWACVTDRRFLKPVRGRLGFMRSGMAIIDLVAVLPFYLPFLGLDLRFVRVFRLARLARVAKVGRYYSSLNLIVNTVRARKEELVLTVAIMVFLLVSAASGVYYAEHVAQPDVFPDIPASLWWAVVTLTTVGYGDAYPITAAGKTLASVISILGIGMFALPTGILGAGFVEEIRRQKTAVAVKRCPHCGADLK